MKYLMTLFFIFATHSIAFASDAVYRTLVPVSHVAVQAVVGCGLRPPGNGRCPTTGTVSFMVKSGGTCHTYRAAIYRSGAGNYLYIYDYELAHCTRPEIENYSTTIPVENMVTGRRLKLANPLYVHIFFRE